jgi:non-heme chloroperoxidase
MFFLGHGYRVIAHDRRGHGRSTQTVSGNNMDTYAADVAELVKALDLKNAVHIGHSAVLISSVPPGLLKSEKNPDGLRDGTANHRSQFYQDITMPFYGFNRPGAQISQGIRDNWWRQGMMGGIKAQYDCIKALSETEFYDDLKSIDLQVLVLHGEDDQICPFSAYGASAIKLLKHGTLKTYPGFPHGMPTTNEDQINADLLAFVKAETPKAVHAS